MPVDVVKLETMHLVWPGAAYLPHYTRALERGWSPDNLRLEAGREELERIARDPDRFLAEQVDRKAKGPPVNLPDGSTVPRLPGYRGDGCGTESSAA